MTAPALAATPARGRRVDQELELGFVPILKRAAQEVGASL